MQIIQRSFTSGELAPSLRARADLNKVTSGLALCENFFIRAQGGAYSRAGQRFIGEIADSTMRGREIPFSFSTDQTYMLIFENLSMQVIRNGAYIETSPGNRFTLVTPYTTAQLARLQFTQSADVMTIVHRGHDTMSLSRTAHDAWGLTVDDYAPDQLAPLIPNLATIGTDSTSAAKTYQYVITSVNDAGVESLPSPMAEITMNAQSVTWGAYIVIPVRAGTAYYRIYKCPSKGTGIYGWIGDTETLFFEDYNTAPITSDAPPSDNQPFSGADNNPGTVGYYQQRRVFANSTNKPQTLWASQTAQYLSMRSSNPTRDDDAIELTIASKQINEIRHIIDVDGLLMLTSHGVWRVTEGSNEVFTPASGVRQTSRHGASWVSPEIVGDSVVYVQDKGARVRDLIYEFSADKYKGTDLSITAEHLFESHIIEEMSYAEEPYSILWMVRDDGVLVGLTYLRDHEVFAWHHHVTNGRYESVATISEGGRDATYVIVNRTIGGMTRRFVERIEPRLFLTAEDSFCVDSGLTYDGRNTSSLTMVVTTDTDYEPGSPLTCISAPPVFTPTDVGDQVVLTDTVTGFKYKFTILEYTSPAAVTGTIDYALPVALQGVATVHWSAARDVMSGLGHLEGEEVTILADGNVVTGLTVSSGEVTLPQPASLVHIGLGYWCTMDTLDVDVTSEKETLKGKEVSVSNVILEVHMSRGGWVGPIADPETSDDPTEEDMREIKPRFQSDEYDTISLRTMKFQQTIEPEWNLGGGIRIQQRSPLPLTILSVIPNVAVGG